MTRSHEDCGKIVHRPYSSCISSVGNLMGTPSSSPCQLRPGGWLSHLGLSHYSRHLDWQIEVERDNENRVLVKREWLEVRATQVAEIIIEGVDLLEKIKKLDAKDNEMIKVVEEMKQAEVKMLRDEEW